jgi:hypothetical protein
MDIKYLKNIPFDVIINNIIPYTYQKQPKKIMNDIRNYYENFCVLENIYSTEYNFIILYNDLIEYCNNTFTIRYRSNDQFINMLKRHYIYKDYSDEMINYYIFYQYNIISYESNCKKKIRFLFGLLKPFERNNFVKRYASQIY